MNDLLRRLGIGHRTVIAGVLNVTPDSFSDGGRFADVSAAVEHAQRMWSEGARIVDIGGESTRPATFHDGLPLDPSEEMRRVLPVIRRLATESPDIVISIDTYKADVAEAAVDAGAAIINDISALSYDTAMAGMVAKLAVPVILMHLPGTPRNVVQPKSYGDIVHTLCEYFVDRATSAIRAGIKGSQIIIDPGLGFGKSAEQNYEILRRLQELRVIGYPLMIGPSRKRFVGAALGNAAVDDRADGTAAAVAIGIAHGADVVRVHDVEQIARVCRMSDAIMRPESMVSV